MAYGLTTSGFVTKRLIEILGEMREEMWSRLGPHLNLEADSAFGQILGGVATQLVDVWSLMQAAYTAMDPDGAEGTMLDNLAAIVGVDRQDAFKATGTVTCTGVSGTVVVEGSIVRVNNGARFVVDEDATISAGTVDVTVTAEDTGPVLIGVGNLDQIVTAISGWDAVTNAAAIDGGGDVETDLELRIRRNLSLQGGGSATDGSIRATVLEIEDVDQCVVVSNRGGSTLWGIPGKAFHTFVWPTSLSATTKEEVAEAVYTVMPAGIEAHGSETFEVTDSRGYDQDVAFSFATGFTVNAVLDVWTDVLFPTNGEDLIKAAVEAVFDAYTIGQNANHSEVHAAAFNACAGITDIDLTINGSTDPIVIDLYTGRIAQMADWGAGSSISFP